MPHLVLIGDSILDNGAYTGSGPAVIQQVSEQLPAGWNATLRAVDGAIINEVLSQLADLPKGTTHLALSVGGNDALMQSNVLDTKVASSSEAFLLLRHAVRAFEVNYKRMLTSCLKLKLPLVVCTIYNANFDDANYQECVVLAISAFNDVIVRAAADHHLKVIDLRAICNTPKDYANAIEPSSCGGAKIAAAIVRAVTEPDLPLRGAYVLTA